MRLIDADALIDEAMDRYCKDCDKRKGIKNGKYRIVYEIGDAPCRACDVDDMVNDIESAPTVDAVEVVRCKDCVYCWKFNDKFYLPKKNTLICVNGSGAEVHVDDFCSWGERRSE